MTKKSDIDKKMAERIAMERKLAGLSQQQLAEMVGYSHKGSINKIELGLTGVSDARLERIAEALRVTVHYLKTGEREITADEPQSTARRPWADELLRLASKLPMAQKALLIDIAAAMVARRVGSSYSRDHVTDLTASPSDVSQRLA